MKTKIEILILWIIISTLIISNSNVSSQNSFSQNYEIFDKYTEFDQLIFKPNDSNLYIGAIGSGVNVGLENNFAGFKFLTINSRGELGKDTNSGFSFYLEKGSLSTNMVLNYDNNDTIRYLWTISATYIDTIRSSKSIIYFLNPDLDSIYAIVLNFGLSSYQIHSIIKVDQSFYVYGEEGNFYGGRNFFVAKIGTDGILQKFVQENYFSPRGGLIFSNNHLILTGSKQFDFDYEVRTILFFDTTLTFQGKKEFWDGLVGGPQNNSFRNTFHLKPNLIGIIGYEKYSINNTIFLLDSFLNEIKRFSLPEGNTFSNIIYVDDSALIIGGKYNSKAYTLSTILMKYKTNGSFVWKRKFEDSIFEYSFGLIKLSKQGNIFGCGLCTITVDSMKKYRGWLFSLDSNGCLIPGCDKMNGIGINNIIQINEPFLSPNPSSEFTTLNFGNDRNEKEIQFFDISGVLIEQISSSKDKIDIPIMNLKQGLYYFRVKINDSYFVLKLVKY